MQVKDILAEATEGDIAKTLYGLKDYNDGKFKSEKQAKFILSKAHDLDGEKFFSTQGSMYKNQFRIDFYLDDIGITRVEKTTNKGGTVIQWERSAEGAPKQQSEKIKSKIRFVDDLQANIDEMLARDEMGNLQRVANEYGRKAKVEKFLNSNGVEYDWEATKAKAIEYHNKLVNTQLEGIKNQAEQIKAAIEALHKHNQNNNFDDIIAGQEEKLKGLRVEYSNIKNDPYTEFFDNLPK